MSTKLNLLVGLSLLTLVNANAWAGMRLSQLITLAESQNPDIVLARQDIITAARDTSFSRILPNPTIVGQFQNSNPAQTNGISQTKASAGISQELLFGIRNARYSVSMSVLNSSIAGKQAKIVEMKKALKDNYFAYQTSYRLIQLQRSAAQKWAELASLAQTKIAEGSVSEVDAGEIQLHRLQTEQRLSELILESKEQESTMALLIGQPSLSDSIEPVVLDSMPSMPALDSLLKLANVNNADLQVFGQEKAAQEAQLVLAKRRAIPPVTVSANYDREREGVDFYGVGLEIGLPVFDRNQAEINHTRSAIEKAALNYKNGGLALGVRVASTYRRLKGEKDQIISFTSTTRNEGARLLELSEKGYRQGMLNIFDLSRIQDGNREQETRYIQLLQQYYTTLSELEFLVGKDLQ